jgi:acyl-CoA thioester hydrolase
MPAAPLALHRATVLPAWVDYNGHMNEAFYLHVFCQTTDAFLDHIGLDDAARRATRSSAYTLEAHLVYLNEAHEGDHLSVTTQLLRHDAKRAQLYHSMIRESDGALVAANELMLLHVDKSGAPRAAPFRPETLEILAAIAADHAALPAPRYAGRVIGFR